MKRVIILGATGNGLFIANLINQTFEDKLSDFKCVGFVNDNLKQFEGFPVIGGFNDIEQIKKDDYNFITALSVDCRPGRREFYEKLTIEASRFTSFIHPTAFISKNVVIGPGVVIGPNVTINSSTIIEEGVRIMPSVSIGAYCKIGEYSFLSVNSCIADYCKVEPGTHIGLSALISDRLTVGDSTLVGMGACLQESAGPNEVWVGNPARFLKKRY